MAPRSTPAYLLLVEHDESTIVTYARMLRLEGYQVQTALSAAEGLRHLESSRPAAIIVDFRMPEMDGLEFLRRLRARDPMRQTPVAIVTGDYFLDETIAAQLRTLGATVRFKPLWLEDLTQLAHDLLTSADANG